MTSGWVVVALAAARLVPHRGGRVGLPRRVSNTTAAASRPVASRRWLPVVIYDPHNAGSRRTLPGRLAQW